MVDLADLISKDYREQISQLHSDRVWGKAGSGHLQEIVEFANEIGAESILDYGCGRGSLKDRIALPVSEFDPGVCGKDKLPEPSDLLVATDVLEHIEPDRVDFTLAYMRTLARKGAFFIISLGTSHMDLPNGKNAHLSVHPGYWWIDKLASVGFLIKDAKRRKGLYVWAT